MHRFSARILRHSVNVACQLMEPHYILLGTGFRTVEHTYIVQIHRFYLCQSVGEGVPAGAGVREALYPQFLSAPWLPIKVTVL